MNYLRHALSVALCGAAAFALTACEGRPRLGSHSSSSTPTHGFFSGISGKILAVDLSDGVPESSGGGFFPLPASRTYVGLVRVLDRAKDDQDVKALYLRLGAQQIGWAKSEELGRLLEELRKRGKPVICHADALTNSSTWLMARGCERIWISPAGGVETVGIASQLLHVKGALDKLDVEADFMGVGKYKSAIEPLTRETPSEAAREATLHVIRSLRKNWIDGVVSARKAPGVKAALEHGPWSAQEAKAKGLIDEVGYETQAVDDAKARAGVERIVTAFGPRSQDSPPDVTEIIRVLTGADERSGGRPHIAVLVAEGAISMEGGGLLDGGGITAKAMNKTIRRLAKDDSVKAVVLRIDSPGGSALASDLIWYELRELGKKKPVIASVGEMAASGGYYLAVGAKEILAERTSIVGSIGVFGGKIVIDEAVGKYGIQAFTLAASEEPGAEARAAYGSSFTNWDEATRERVKQTMVGIYELFLDRIAQGRNIPADKIRPYAQGRIWTGEQGKQHALVDRIGGLAHAIARARELGELDERAPVVVEGGADSIIQSLLLGDDDNASAERVGLALARAEARRSPLWQKIPAELRVFAAACSPLAQGETTVAALPFAVIVH